MNRFFGGVLMAVGLLVMTCSGLCSLVVIVSGFELALQAPSALLVPLVIGGIPFMLGFAALRWGQSLLRRTDDGE